MFQHWPKRDPNKHCYLVPNEVFNLGLSSHEIAVYNYLLCCEDRRTYQRQFQQAERDMERARAEKRLAELNQQNKKKEEESA